MKKLKKIMAAALAMMTFSTAAAVTGTVAWFTANNIVSASGMNIQAEAENGIVIANETHVADSDWLTTVTASHDGNSKTFIPTSTGDLVNWFHGLSDKADNGQSNVKYDKFISPADDDKDGVYTALSSAHFTTDAKNVYLKNDFYVQASAKTAITNQNIYIEEIAITGNTNSVELDKSLRVGLMVNDSFKAIYAPLTGATISYTVCTSVTQDNPSTTDTNEYSATVSTAVSAIDVSAANDSNLVYTGDIPAYDTAGSTNIKFSVFVYFEGEDKNHKSANLQNTLDTLALSFKLRNANVA